MMMPLTPEFKAKTLAALRYGEYKQKRGCIGDFHTKCLCCIGVSAAANGLGDAITTGIAVQHIGLTEEEKNEWVEWNDDMGLNFVQIAAKIEAEY
jgi:hypothetical protein